MIVMTDDLRKKIDSLQSPNWDHRDSLSFLIENSPTVYLLFKKYTICNNTIQSGYVDSILIKDLVIDNHYTELIINEGKLEYYSDAYYSPDYVKENSDKFEWISFNDVAFYEFISKYLDLITCAEDLERTMLHLKVNDKIGPSCVDVSIGYGHLH